jgi:hypothetical protein
MFPRLLIAAVVCLAAPAWGGPPLTTVQDVLYKADGTRFNGTLTISWKSFEAADHTTIAMHSMTTRVVDGNVHVQLVPTTTSNPAVLYQVIYNSDGRIQFQETWSVPERGQPIRIRDVRVGTIPVAPDTDGNGPVTESDVIGLIADLGMRPVKGPGFAAGRVAVVSPAGMIDSVTGSASDCVRVDGSSGPCGGDPPAFVDGDLPSGIVDGANTIFTLSGTPDPPSSLAIYRNGLLQKISQDYTFAGRTLQFVTDAAPQPGDTLLASYRLTGSDSSQPQLFPASQVLCSGTGLATMSTSLTSIGACSIPSGVLKPGDRVEVLFDLAHQGTASGFSLEARWGNTIVAHRDAAAADTLVTGRADAAILVGSSQLSYQTWGTVLPFTAGIISAADSYATGLTVDFRGKLAQAGDTLTLVNYTVVLLP